MPRRIVRKSMRGWSGEEAAAGESPAKHVRSRLFSCRKYRPDPGAASWWKGPPSRPYRGCAVRGAWDPPEVPPADDRNAEFARFGILARSSSKARAEPFAIISPIGYGKFICAIVDAVHRSDIRSGAFLRSDESRLQRDHRLTSERLLLPLTQSTIVGERHHAPRATAPDQELVV